MRVEGTIGVSASPESVRIQLDHVEKLAAIDTETRKLTVLERTPGAEVAEFTWRPFHVFPMLTAVFRYDHKANDQILWESVRGLPWPMHRWSLRYVWGAGPAGLILTRSENYKARLGLLGELMLWPVWPIARFHLWWELRTIRDVAEGKRKPPTFTA